MPSWIQELFALPKINSDPDPAIFLSADPGVIFLSAAKSEDQNFFNFFKFVAIILLLLLFFVVA
jgi:hypothetical protein